MPREDRHQLARTAKALEYVKSLYETFVPGTVSWNDSSNNKAFLAGDLYLTNNGNLDLCRGQEGQSEARRGYGPRGLAVGPRMASRRNSSSPSRSWLQVFEGAQCLQGVHRLHDGRRAITGRGSKPPRVISGAAVELSEEPDLDERSEERVFAEAGRRSLAAGGLAP